MTSDRHIATRPVEPDVTDIVSDRETTVQVGDRDRAGDVARIPSLRAWVPGVLAVLVTGAILVDNDVDPGDLVRYASYWVVCVLIPGILVHRALIGRRPFFAEELAVGAVTGIALEVITWLVLDRVGLFPLVRWWWVAAYVVFLAVPRLRRHWRPGFERPTPPAWAWAMSGLIVVVVVTVAVSGFRAFVVAPTPGQVYVDQWYHLSLVQELMRAGPHELPQVAGEPLRYHLHSHVHMANAARITGVAPDVVLMRLWVVPVIAATVGLIGAVARQVTRRTWTGPVAAWLTVGGLAGGYLWVDRTIGATSPIVYLSPSQMLANPVVLAAAIGFVVLLRGDGTRRTLAWLALLIVLGVGAKPTVLPVLGAAAMAAVVARWILDRRFPRIPAFGLAMVLVVQGAWLAIAAPKSGGVSILGTLTSVSVYRDIVHDGQPTLRAVSDGLFLDSLSGGRAWLAAAVALTWLAATQIVRLVGLVGLAHPALRRDPVAWFLGGGVVAGWGAFLVFDQAAFGQAYFQITVIPLGAVLSVWFLAAVLERTDPAARWRAVLAGLAIGAVSALLVRGFLSGRSSSPAYGAYESALSPLVLGAAALGLGWFVWSRWAARQGMRGLGGAVVLTSILATTVPAAVTGLTRQVGAYSVADPQAGASGGTFAPAGEQEAMLWLRDNTGERDVVATNAHCRPLDSQAEFCNATSFLVSGVGGRRVLLEGWAYTGDALELHGDGGRSYQFQPSPWPERYALSQAALADPTDEVLSTLRDEYGVEWLVGVRRAGPVSERLDDLAEPVFDNGDVAIYGL